MEIEEGSFSIEADKKFLGQAVSNLIINGIQAMDESENRRIDVRLTKKNLKKCTLEVRDYGRGIEENIQDKIFIPNFSTKSSGSGIGLAISKRAVEHASGDIWFETKTGAGTSFFIELPLIN